MNHCPHRVDPLLLNRAKEMRREPAPTEQLLWQCLRNRQLNGFKFRRQFAINHYVADFCCPECKLIVELDGESHEDRQEYDEQRTARLSEFGFSVIRFSNTDVHDNLEGVLLTILLECEARMTSSFRPSPGLSPAYRGEEKEQP